MAETKKIDSKLKVQDNLIKSSSKEDSKMKELKIELLKQGSKKRDIRREIARMLTLQQNKMDTKK